VTVGYGPKLRIAGPPGRVAAATGQAYRSRNVSPLRLPAAAHGFTFGHETPSSCPELTAGLVVTAQFPPLRVSMSGLLASSEPTATQTVDFGHDT